MNEPLLRTGERPGRDGDEEDAGLRSRVAELEAVLAAERHRFEVELVAQRRRVSELEERYRGMIDRLDAIFWEADARTFEFTYVSPRAEALLGYPMSRWLGEPRFWETTLHPEDRDWVVATCAAATAAGRNNDFQYRALAADGRVVWLRDMVYVELDEAGAPRLLRGVMLDVTAQKHVEEELRRSGAAKDRFLAMLAHELRNPLGAISNALQVLRRCGPGHASWPRALDVAERQVRHQGQLLDDLLDVSRLTRGKLELRREPLDLGQLVAETAEDARGELEGSGLALSIDIPAEPLWVEGDRTQLAQVLLNLLSNARKFTESGGRVDVRGEVDEAGFAAVRVRDSGIGIEAEMLPQVFEVFSQADVSLERSQGGLGLGLALVQGLVGLHGGVVRAESPGTGKGATFSFALPQVPAPRAEPWPEPPPRAEHGLRILLVEDNVDAAEMLGELLELSGHQVETAHSGPAGLEAARRFLPEVVLCDIGLPGMDGYEVCRQLRADPVTRGAHLVALTGYGGESDRMQAREAGFDLHLVKPVGPDQLQRLLAVWAAGKAGQGLIPPPGAHAPG
ncbi:MAG TPA: ATP-binding protein [Thermoanaerobaculia bacterium]|nr:ATP-binding protein [Thermoanaerobaculia bacterium]